MTTNVRWTRGAAMAAAVAVALGGMFFAQPATAQMSSTKHNLSATGPGTAGQTRSASETQICVFCHTPHGSNTTAGNPPLWNRVAANAPEAYQTYQDVGGGTLDGTTLAVGSVSLACLSCHDGTQAMDTVINAPGSGGFNSAGARIPGANLGAMPAGVTNLGTDLRNDHPIGIQYGGFLIDGKKIDPDFREPTKHTTMDRWWVNTTVTEPNPNDPGNPIVVSTAARDKTDMILYTRANGSDQPFVECASCHDPHSTNTTFLRIANTGSAVCLACHVK